MTDDQLMVEFNRIRSEARNKRHGLIFVFLFLIFMRSCDASNQATRANQAIQKLHDDISSLSGKMDALEAELDNCK